MTDTDRITLNGIDSRGDPRQAYADMIAVLDAKHLAKETENQIWNSAFYSHRAASDHHWQCSACYAEAKRRGLTDLYQRAWERASA